MIPILMFIDETELGQSSHESSYVGQNGRVNCQLSHQDGLPLAYFNDIVVGAVCCREDKTNNERRLYIMTLGCLAPYRRLGIGTVMLEHVLKICETDGQYDNVFLHVQINNDSAIKFYEKFGFEIVEKKENYYKRIEPADAYVLQKTFRKRDKKTEGKQDTTDF